MAEEWNALYVHHFSVNEIRITGCHCYIFKLSRVSSSHSEKSVQGHRTEPQWMPEKSVENENSDLVAASRRHLGTTCRGDSVSHPQPTWLSLAPRLHVYDVWVGGCVRCKGSSWPTGRETSIPADREWNERASGSRKKKDKQRIKLMAHSSNGCL